MQRGEIWLCDLEPALGHEANKVRPCVIVSNDDVNSGAERRGKGVVTVVPITSNTARIFSFQVELPAGEVGLNRDSKAQAEQIRSISTQRLTRRIGLVPLHLMSELDDALRLHLSL